MALPRDPLTQSVVFVAIPRPRVVVAHLEQTMARTAEHVFTAPEDIARLEHLVEELAVNARVRLHTVDAGVVEGVVSVTPTVQVLHSPQGDEGINGVVKLIDADRPAWEGLVWLGDIRRVEHLNSVRKGTSKA